MKIKHNVFKVLTIGLIIGASCSLMAMEHRYPPTPIKPPLQLAIIHPPKEPTSNLTEKLVEMMKNDPKFKKHFEDEEKFQKRLQELEKIVRKKSSKD